METAPLKVFATSARTELIREVTARITAVLAPGSPDRVESPTTVADLEKAVAAGGRGDEGKSHVADKVAYTWFNRIIALRFMDANGYTGIGVVSPAADQVGQPEVLAAAKRGQVDKEVVSSDHSMAAIAGLLNGTRQPRLGADAQAEAYSLLLVAYCQFWHKAMPFMFERQGDFTELLIPANLLAGDSVLSRSVEVLTEDACKDVEVIGWLYQFYISERKDEVFAGFKKNKKAGADEIPAATQLFTPHWIVRYLVENSLGRLWMLNRPDSGLLSLMDYYIAPVDEEVDFLKISRPEQLTVIDPACGSGHMLTYAFDLLYAIYDEEGYAPSEIPGLILANNLFGTEIDPRAAALAAFALTMKAAGKRKLFLKSPVRPRISIVEPISFDRYELDFLATAAGCRADEEAFWNQFAEADTFGSLIQSDTELVARLARHLDTLNFGGDIYEAAAIESAKRVIAQAEYLAPKYAIVVANPPYMGSGNMGGTLAAWLKLHYPTARHDLMTAFMARATSLCMAGGVYGIINLPSWMFLSSYATLRSDVLKHSRIASMLHLGRGVFGSDFGSVAFVVENLPPTKGTTAVYRRLFDAHVDVRPNTVIEARFLDKARDRYLVRQSELQALPGSPIAYWLPATALSAYALGERLGDVAYGQPGLQTSNNAKFIRFWFEVSGSKIGIGISTSAEAKETGCRWFPYLKGGDFRKWFGNELHVVDWENDGERIKKYVNQKYPYLKGNIDYVVKDRGYYFKPMISYTKIGSGRFAARSAAAGYLFDVAGSAVFPSDHDMPLVLGFLCSRVGEMFLGAQNPTVNVQSGDIDRLPYAPTLIAPFAGSIRNAVIELIELAKSDWNSRETSLGFIANPLVGSGTRPSDRRLADVGGKEIARQEAARARATALESFVDQQFLAAYGIADGAVTRLTVGEPSVDVQSEFELAIDLISYAVGCMLGRYSLYKSGLMLADQSISLKDVVAQLPTQTFKPDDDNAIPMVGGDWFEDDIVGRFRHFLRIAFGEKHFEENLRFVTEALGVKNLREYFITKAGRSKFYDDHVQRYKKRPIYWLFSSPKGSFNALIYLHRYTPSTASTVLTYLREYVTKLESSLQQAERGGDAKEADRLRKILVELNEYEHDMLYPKASENVVIDLDDGVKVNYPKLGGALRKIAGLESSSD